MSYFPKNQDQPLRKLAADETKVQSILEYVRQVGGGCHFTDLPPSVQQDPEWGKALIAAQDYDRPEYLYDVPGKRDQNKGSYFQIKLCQKDLVAASGFN